MAYAILFSIMFILLAAGLLVVPTLYSLFGSLLINAQSAPAFSNGQGISQNNGYNLLYYNAPKPQAYSTLAYYMLTLINNDRINNGVTRNVSLDYNPAAQQHAYSMLVNNYFSHWDTQGYKPYMRYTLAGGNGSVEENIAYMEYTGKFTSISAVEDALKQLEYQMVYNDSAHQNGHRDNILDPFHNYVSIGIVYDVNFVYLVEDFENLYINWTHLPFIASNGQVEISGYFPYAKSVQMVEIFYDPLPSSLSSSQLDNFPYNGGYDQGTFVAGVVPKGYQVNAGLTITASIWYLSTSQLQIVFDIKSLIGMHGSGVYTIYLVISTPSGGQESFTSYSFFVTNSTT